MEEQDVTTQPHLLALPGKVPGDGPSSARPSLTGDAKQYVDGLTASRNAAVAALSSAAGSSIQEDTARAYLAQLLGLCRQEFGMPGSDSTSQDFLLRRSLPFAWREVYTAPGGSNEQCSARDAVFEVASLLQAIAAVKMAGAAALCRGATPSAAALQGYKLLREAAGALATLQMRVLPVMAACPSADLSREMVVTLQNLALADAQTLTLLRAAKRNHQPALISSLASDTAALYSAALSSLLSLAPLLGWQARGRGGSKSRPGPPSGDAVIDAAIPGSGVWPRAGPALKLAAYLQYKYAHCRATAFAYGALAALGSHEGGAAVALATEAVKLVKYVYALANDYDRASPITSRSEHEEAERGLDKLAADALRKATSDNHSIYLQPVPKALPPLPEPRRAVEPIPYDLPLPPADQPSAAVGLDLVALVAGDKKLRRQAEAESAAAAAAVMGTGAGQGSAVNPDADGMMMMERPQPELSIGQEGAGPAVAVGTAGAAGAGPATAATALNGAAGVSGKNGHPVTGPSSRQKQHGATPVPSAQPHGLAAVPATSPPAAATASTTATATTKPGSSDGPPEGDGGCSLCRCLVTAICMPLLVLVSLVGVVVWIVLLPFKCCICCCPVACIAQLLWDVVEWLIKAPLRWAMWASGKPHQPRQYPGAEKQPRDIEAGNAG